MTVKTKFFDNRFRKFKHHKRWEVIIDDTITSPMRQNQIRFGNSTWKYFRLSDDSVMMMATIAHIGKCIAREFHIFFLISTHLHDKIKENTFLQKFQWFEWIKRQYYPSSQYELTWHSLCFSILILLTIMNKASWMHETSLRHICDNVIWSSQYHASCSEQCTVHKKSATIHMIGQEQIVGEYISRFPTINKCLLAIRKWTVK